MVLKFNNQSEFLESFANGALKGCMPSEKIDTNTLEYPVCIEVDDGFFKLYIETPKVETIKEVKKKGLSKKAIVLLSTLIPLSVAIIVGVILAFVLTACSAKTYCAQYDKDGICRAETVIYKAK